MIDYSYTPGGKADTRPNPQKRNILIQRISRAPWWLLLILAGVLAFITSVSGSDTYRTAWEEVQLGIGTTIWVTVVAYALALALGLILALLRRPSRSVAYNILVYQPATTFVEIVRGIPTLVLVFYITLAFIPQLVGLGNEIGASLLEQGQDPLGLATALSEFVPRDFPVVWRAIIALAVSYAAFLSEIFRAGLESVPSGHLEAGRSLGMTEWQVTRHILLPQAIRNVLPPLGNDFIAMLKESSLVSIVGVNDITREGQTFAAATFTFFQSYNIVAITYLVMTLALSMLVKGMEWFIDRGREDE